jgi:predicted O-methyltransferase YrrM
MTMKNLKAAVRAMARVADLVMLPLTAVAALWLKQARRIGLQRMPLTRRVLRAIGVLPVRDHYYEPLINPKALRYPLDRERELRGVDLNVAEQLSLLERFSYQAELDSLPRQDTGRLEFFYHNASFESGDAEFYYSIIRLLKPGKIIEIGSGHSTLMAVNAINMNRKADAGYTNELICIEPYEQPWLERLGVKVLRSRAEELGYELFESLRENDILFIDSSHVIRPQGDVLFEVLELFPRLRSGVLIHVHDIFTPRDYLQAWIVDEAKLWNEQYLLEAFLSVNSEFQVIGALNYLKHHYPRELGARLPVLGQEMQSREPGSFWIRRR